MQAQALVPPGDASPGQDHVQRVGDEGPELGPCLRNGRSQKLRMPSAREGRESVVVDHDAARAPEKDHRDVGMQDEFDGQPKGLRPGFPRPEFRAGPGEGEHEFPKARSTRAGNGGGGSIGALGAVLGRQLVHGIGASAVLRP